MMPRLFFKVDANYCDDERILSISAEAEAVFLRSVALAKRRASDGVIARVHLRALTDRCEAPAERLAGELVDAGLWEEHDGGWIIPSFLKHNPSAEQLEEARRAEAERKAAYRARQQRPKVSDRTSESVPPDTNGRAEVSDVPRRRVRDEREREKERERVRESSSSCYAHASVDQSPFDATVELLLARRRSLTDREIRNEAAWAQTVRAGLVSEHGDRIGSDLALGLDPETIARSLIPLPSDRIPEHARSTRRLV